MQRAIWKYPLTTTYEQRVSMPVGAVLLTVQTQDGVPTVWALVDVNAPRVDRVLRIYGTGNPIPEGDASRYCNWRSIYVGTYQLRDGTVWHVFDNSTV